MLVEIRVANIKIRQCARQRKHTGRKMKTSSGAMDSSPEGSDAEQSDERQTKAKKSERWRSSMQKAAAQLTELRAHLSDYFLLAP